MGYLLNSLRDIVLGCTHNLYRHSPIITDAFPNIGGTAGGDGILAHLDGLSWNSVGGW